MKSYIFSGVVAGVVALAGAESAVNAAVIRIDFTVAGNSGNLTFDSANLVQTSSGDYLSGSSVTLTDSTGVFTYNGLTYTGLQVYITDAHSNGYVDQLIFASSNYNGGTKTGIRIYGQSGYNVISSTVFSDALTAFSQNGFGGAYIEIPGTLFSQVSSYSVSTVPEPASLGVLTVAGLLVALRRRSTTK